MSGGTINTASGDGVIARTGAQVTVTGGTINAGYAGINTAGNVVIGSTSSMFNHENPVIQGKAYGIYKSNGTWKFYNGIIKGGTDAYTAEPDNIRENYEIYHSTETIESTTYKTAYLIPQTSNYVQNGLILHYDAINNTGSGHSSTTTTWNDLSGNNNDGTIVDGAWNENSIKLSNNNSGIIGNYSDSLKLTDFTIEIMLLSYTESSNGGLLYDFHTGGESGYFSKIYNNSLLLAFGNTRYNYSYDFINSDYPIKITITCEKSNDNTSISINGINSDNHTGNVNIEKAQTSTFGILNNDARNEGVYLGEMGNFKIYNRALTDAEVLQNYNVDKARFNIE